MQIEADRWPAVDARRLQTVIQLDLSSDVVGQRLSARPELDQRVGLLDAAAEDASRPVILEAATHKANSVRQQRRGERVPVKPRVLSAVEREIERPGAVDAPSFREPVGLSHR